MSLNFLSQLSLQDQFYDAKECETCPKYRYSEGLFAIHHAFSSSS